MAETRKENDQIQWPEREVTMVESNIRMNEEDTLKNPVCNDGDDDDDDDVDKGNGHDDYDKEGEDDDDEITHFQAQVLKRGSIRMERRRTLSPRSRGQRKRNSDTNVEKLKQGGNSLLTCDKYRACNITESNKPSIAMNLRHLEILNLAVDRVRTQIPRSLELEIRAEAYLIIQDTAQAYKRLLGKKHRLTNEANEYLSTISYPDDQS